MKSAPKPHHFANLVPCLHDNDILSYFKWIFHYSNYFLLIKWTPYYPLNLGIMRTSFRLSFHHQPILLWFQTHILMVVTNKCLVRALSSGSNKYLTWQRQLWCYHFQYILVIWKTNMSYLLIYYAALYSLYIWPHYHNTWEYMALENHTNKYLKVALI